MATFDGLLQALYQIQEASNSARRKGATMTKITQTQKGAALCAEAELQSIVNRITRFDRRCSQDEYTDSGEAWGVLYRVRTDARRALREFKRAQS